MVITYNEWNPDLICSTGFDMCDQFFASPGIPGIFRVSGLADEATAAEI